MANRRSFGDTEKVVEQFRARRTTGEVDIKWTAPRLEEPVPPPPNKIAQGSSRHPVDIFSSSRPGRETSPVSVAVPDEGRTGRRSGSFELGYDLFSRHEGDSEPGSTFDASRVGDDGGPRDTVVLASGSVAAAASGSAAARPDAALVGLGTVIGSYRVIEQISRGGMGAVYRAEHTLLGRPTAIKVLLPEYCHQGEFVKRFLNEAKALTSITHPACVQVFDFGFHDERSAYIAMELLSGQTLRERLAGRKRMPVAEAMRVVREIASVLAEAHAKGVVHRDLKPGNIFLVEDPRNPLGYRIKVLDFGLAKLLQPDPANQVNTMAGKLMGTPQYMSPEQCRMSKDIDYRTDIYALGCLTFRLLCGRPPFLEKTTGDVLAHQLKTPAPAPSAFEPLLPPEIDEFVLKALSKGPEDRHQSMDEVIGDIDRILEAESRFLDSAGTRSAPTPSAGRPATQAEPDEPTDDWVYTIRTVPNLAAADAAGAHAATPPTRRGGRLSVILVALVVSLVIFALAAVTLR